MFFHNDYANIKFEPGITRIVFDDIGMERENYDVRRIETLKGILKIISSAHAEEYDQNLNGMSFDELSERFGENMVAASNEDYERINSTEYNKNDSYKIVEIHSFDEAEKYYKYTNPNSRWCLTHMENMWDTYTGNGRNKVYFVLRDGFEDMKPEKGENCPLDEYGLSMICVIVTNDIGDDDRPMLCTCACRWNHDNGGSDRVMDVEQISNVIGESFYNAFKPFSLEELHSRGIYTFREKIEEYERTHDTEVFYAVENFREGRARVELDDKYNFIDEEGNIIYKQWFDDACIFSEGRAGIELNGKWNFIDKDGNILFKQWFDYVGVFSEGRARVRLKDKGWNFIDEEGNIISKQWFDYVDDFNEGYAAVKLNGKWNFIDKDGNFLWKGEKWFDDVYEFYGGDAKVSLNGKWTFIDKEGKLHDR